MSRHTSGSRRPRQPLEKHEQHGICQLVESLGGKPYVLGTRRRREDYQGTMQTPGVPDMWIVLPGLERHTRNADPPETLPPLAAWWECKRQDGRRTEAQLEFARACDRAGVAYGHGTLDDFIAWLIQRGRLRADQVAHYRVPQGSGKHAEA